MLDISEIPSNVINHCEEYSKDVLVNVGQLRDYDKLMKPALHEQIITNIQNYIANHSENIGQNFSKKVSGSFQLDGESYTIEVVDDVVKLSNIIIRIWSKRDSSRPSDLKNEKICNSKFYDTISYNIDSKLNDLSEAILIVSNLVIEAYDRWFLGKIETVNIKNGQEIVSEWYALMRSLFPLEVHSKIYLYMFQDEVGIYLLDQFKVRDTVNILSDKGRESNDHFYTLFSTFAYSTNEFENMAAKIAIPENRTVIVEHGDSRFSGHDPDTGMGFSESLIFEDKNLVVQPLITEGNILLEAAYPPSLKSSVEDVLVRERKRFQEILRSNRNVPSLLMSDVKISTFTDSMVEKMGIFAGSYAAMYQRWS